MEPLKNGTCSTCKHNKKSHHEKYCYACIEATFTAFQHPEFKYPEFPEWEPKEDLHGAAELPS